MSLEQIWVVPKFDEVILSNPTPGPSSNPTSFEFIFPPQTSSYNNLGQITEAHDSSTVTTEFWKSIASFLEALSPIPTLKIVREERGSNNVARKLTRAESLASTKTRIANRSRREGQRQKEKTPKRGTTSRLTGAGSLLPPVFSEAWAKENAEVSQGHQSPPYGRSMGKGSPGHHFPPYETPHTANMRVDTPTLLVEKK
ncbi:hypothetical protein TNCV_29301 [Trichonephila clavipes]|nr:hypothetical protein TNCV_29301 [Trichonephila clavipes]